MRQSRLNSVGERRLKKPVAPAPQCFAASLNAGEIDDSRFNALYAAKNIGGQFRRDMKRRAVPFEKRRAERRTRRAEGDGVDRRAVARAQSGAHMIGADDLCECDLLLGQDEHRLRIALSEWSRPLDPSQQIETDPSSREGGVEDERVFAPGDLDGRFEGLIEKDAKIVEPIARERHAGGHGVSAALDRESQIDGAPHRRAKIDTT